ncbi:hypothetical protein DPMN_093009 [Dreissena polymorpha]|uniref:Uncharacterized protein n=1 Tax=Dreissena polymorpha TaxID=45954 RepID=A0A9D4L4Q5_DREPO|nr:hypothetical protein DPMN_093009 [Dreissena polymorpha]
MGNGSEDDPSKTTVPFMSLWKDITMLRKFGVQPIFSKRLNSPSQLTKSKAFVRSMKAKLRGVPCSLHFSWSKRYRK